MRFVHDNTERSKNVMMAAVPPPSSNAMNGCTFADIVVNLKNIQRIMLFSLALLGTRLCSMSNYSRTTAGLECTALTGAQESPNDNYQSKTTANRGTYLVEMSMQPQRS